MKINIIALILLSVSLGIIGQLLFKKGMDVVGEVNLSFSVIKAFFNPYVFLGLVCYGTGTCSWLVVLSRTPVSFAYPWLSIGYIIITIADKFYFHQIIPPLRWVGILLISIGVALLGLGGINK